MKIYGITGWKNAGKTGLTERLLTEFVSRGFVVSSLKHAHHNFDVDQPGKDSYRHRAAGAREVLLSSSQRWALMSELRGDKEPSLANLLGRLAGVDLVLIEGFKNDDHPKIEAVRAENNHPLIGVDDVSVRAFASDAPVPDTRKPVFDLDDTSSIADFILQDLEMAAVPVDVPVVNVARLSNDCFALPQGTNWTPVDVALDHLRTNMTCTVASRTIDVGAALNRILATDQIAKRSNPPAANSAVDGYGFAGSVLGSDATVLPLVEGRAAAGQPFVGTVPNGYAVRILTGAILPHGVDTVVLEEDVTINEGHVAFDGTVKPGSNARRAGEDLKAGAIALAAGHRLRSPDIAMLAAIGISTAQVHDQLKVGVLSTGDELVAPGSTDDPARTFDANRPMLLSMAQRWGYQSVDLGHAVDNRETLAASLTEAAKSCDIILTSGGASAGEEDHVSALLTDAGAMQHWRIALKPGRPLALGLWQGVPVFGLPGNPVAAFVCAVIFARPACQVMAGSEWSNPQGFYLPSDFTKSKKAGRREYLRARVNPHGNVEVFASEGSGRISGLSWADGLVELPDEAQEIRPGDRVRYIPYSSFGL